MPVDVDPEVILEFWFGDAVADPGKATARERLWFGAASETDAVIERLAPIEQAFLVCRLSTPRRSKTSASARSSPR
jgi:hypothetical protein